METQHTGTALQAGDFIEGGYFVGAFNLNGERFGLIVSPRAEGDKDRTAWGEVGENIPATSCVDGRANTQAMAEADCELGKWALALNINGYSDWYLPSRDELEMLYRYLKPGTDRNFATFRDGDNPSSIPAGYPYTKEDPVQTDIEAFRTGGKEAMKETAYWSSAQYSANNAWGQTFDGGIQNGVHKNVARRARAVRRFKLPI